MKYPIRVDPAHLKLRTAAEMKVGDLFRGVDSDLFLAIPPAEADPDEPLSFCLTGDHGFKAFHIAHPTEGEAIQLCPTKLALQLRRMEQNS